MDSTHSKQSENPAARAALWVVCIASLQERTQPAASTARARCMKDFPVGVKINLRKFKTFSTVQSGAKANPINGAAGGITGVLVLNGHNIL